MHYNPYFISNTILIWDIVLNGWKVVLNGQNIVIDGWKVVFTPFKSLNFGLQKRSTAYTAFTIKESVL